MFFSFMAIFFFKKKKLFDFFCISFGKVGFEKLEEKNIPEIIFIGDETLRWFLNLSDLFIAKALRPDFFGGSGFLEQRAGWLNFLDSSGSCNLIALKCGGVAPITVTRFKYSIFD